MLVFHPDKYVLAPFPNVDATMDAQLEAARDIYQGACEALNIFKVTGAREAWDAWKGLNARERYPFHSTDGPPPWLADYAQTPSNRTRMKRILELALPRGPIPKRPTPKGS